MDWVGLTDVFCLLLQVQSNRRKNEDLLRITCVELKENYSNRDKFLPIEFIIVRRYEFDGLWTMLRRHKETNSIKILTVVWLSVCPSSLDLSSYTPPTFSALPDDYHIHLIASIFHIIHQLFGYFLWNLHLQGIKNV